MAIKSRFVRIFIKNKNQYVQFKGHINYDNLPTTLNKYQVGVILYKGHIPNYVYNAPNKLFEYLAAFLMFGIPNNDWHQRICKRQRRAHGAGA